LCLFEQYIMNWYRLAQEQYYFVTDCVSAKGDDITEMVDEAEDVTWEEFNRHVSNDEIRLVMGDFYDYDDQDNNAGLKFQDDPYVSFHKSVYRGRPCYYFDHSAIEYVFCPINA